jgi:triosephosphate isomerase
MMPFVCGNWKMHLAPEPAAAFAKEVVAALGSFDGVNVGIAPTFVSLHAVRAVLDPSCKLFGQNCHWAAEGAFTGEISAPMLKTVGCDGVIVGHSERRHYFGETDATVNARTKAAIAAGLHPIVCVGETLAQREAGETLAVVERMVRGGLAELTPEQISGLVVAYEPVWAVGTGKIALPAQAQEVHGAIRRWLKELAGKDIGTQVRILYGGSVKPNNVTEMMDQPDIDGALVGGASLKADEFAAIAIAAREAKRDAS